MNHAVEGLQLQKIIKPLSGNSFDLIRQLTVTMIKEQLGLTRNAVLQILTNGLDIKQICVKMILKNLSQQEGQVNSGGTVTSAAQLVDDLYFYNK